MHKTDEQLGMNKGIVRTDFIQATVLTSLGLMLLTSYLVNNNENELLTKYYPPITAGMRSSHEGSYEAHALACQGTQFDRCKQY